MLEQLPSRRHYGRIQNHMRQDTRRAQTIASRLIEHHIHLLYRHLLDKRQTQKDVQSRDHPSLSESPPVSLPSFHSLSLFPLSLFPLSLFPLLPLSLTSLLSSPPASRSSSHLSLSSFLSSFLLSLFPPPSLSLPSLSFTRQAREEGQQLVREWQNRHTELDTALRYVCSVHLCHLTACAAAKGHVHGRAAAMGL